MAKLFMVAVGNPADGYTYCGPFFDPDAATTWAEQGRTDDQPWWVVPLEEPVKAGALGAAIDAAFAVVDGDGDIEPRLQALGEALSALSPEDARAAGYDVEQRDFGDWIARDPDDGEISGDHPNEAAAWAACEAHWKNFPA